MTFTRSATRRTPGFTMAEILTVVVVIAVLAAVAVPMWRVHLLRVRRSDAINALIAVQNAEDQYFGRNAHYASGNQLNAPGPGGLGLESRSAHGYYDIEVRSSDGLAFLATARANQPGGQSDDSRCAEFSIDHNGMRRAVDAGGQDRSADCWH
jgi:type IV pilus assembly protein PilE